MLNTQDRPRFVNSGGERLEVVREQALDDRIAARDAAVDSHSFGCPQAPTQLIPPKIIN